MGFRVGPFVLCKNGCWRRRRRNTNSIAFGKSTSQRIYSKQRTHKIGKKRHKYGLKYALHTLDGHFR